MKRKYIIILAVIVIIICAVPVSVTRITTNLSRLADLQVQDIDISKIPDGTYTGSYSVFPVAVKVKVTVSKHKISEIEILKHNNGQGAPAEIITERVKAAQSLDVDIISGATYSSKVILKAIENALNSANK
jgi:uncharacterized protein with FMN-binding domain